MVELTIDKDLLNEYRDYKLDLMNGVVNEDFQHTALQYLLSNGKTTLSKIHSRLGDSEWIKINVINGDILEIAPSRYESDDSDFDFDFDFDLF